jgi:hypothetical protein
MTPKTFDPGGPVPLHQQLIVDHVLANPMSQHQVATPWWKVTPEGTTCWDLPIPPQDGSDKSAMRTPLRPRAWAAMLSECQAKDEASFVLEMINAGADIQFRGDRTVLVEADNLRSALSHPEAIEEYLKDEAQKGRIEGPFQERPSTITRIVPMGSVPKDEDKRRIILNYSAPDGLAINEEIEKLECQLEQFDKVMDMLGELPTGTKLIKIDVKAAFRLVPVKPMDSGLLGMQWKGLFYKDNCLPFGLSSSPPLWERVSRALEWILRKWVTPHVAHYVDDFMLAIPQGWDPERVLARALAIFDLLGVPISIGKLVGPTTQLEFLGIAVDSVQRICQVAPAKRKKLIGQLQIFAKCSKVAVKRLESVVGLLQFVTNVVRPGKAFIARLRDSLRRASGPMVSLGPVGKADAQWWLKYLPTWPGRSYLRPATEGQSNTTNISTDACREGMAAVFGTRWCQSRWSEAWIKRATREKTVSMPFLELAAVVIGVRTWASDLAAKTVVVYCDCEPVVLAASRGYSPQAGMMGLLRDLAALAMTHMIRFRFVHIASETNHVADLLSRFNTQEALDMYSWLDRAPAIASTGTGQAL